MSAADEAERRSLACSAAHQAAIAVAELLRYAKEGDAGSSFRFDEEVADLLLDAAKMAIEVEGERRTEPGREQIYADLRRHLEGWAG